MNKAIFLDVDGIIAFNNKLSKQCLTNLSSLIKSLGNTDIIIISSWRRQKSSRKLLKTVFTKYDLKISGWTDITDEDESNRPQDIQDFIKEKNIDKYVIIDDVIHLDYIRNKPLGATSVKPLDATSVNDPKCLLLIGKRPFFKDSNCFNDIKKEIVKCFS